MTSIPHDPNSWKPRAIETAYKNYLFRSRNEARWAVFFDQMKVKWTYEEEGFELPSGRYLPDFFLPELEMFVEVKPKSFAERLGRVLKSSALYRVSEDRDIKRALELANTTGFPVKFACGDPVDEFGTDVPDEWNAHPGNVICPTNDLKRAAYHRENMAYVAFNEGPLPEAAIYARQARFEFGATP